MRTYIEFALKRFQNKMVYRMDFFMGIINTIFSVVVYLCIYRALYAGRSEVDGITFNMVATNFIISLGLSQAFQFNELEMPGKISDGSITNEFLRPVNFRLRMLSENVGEGAFKIIFQFIPAVLFTLFYTKLCPPQNAGCFALMLVSVAMGYLVLWLISFIVQTWCFWILSIWGIVTIKNVFINVLSGSLLPIWFMPPLLRKIVTYTPFESIYFTPVRIYLGELSGIPIARAMGIQLLWIIILYFIGNFFWNKGTKKLIIQGG